MRLIDLTGNRYGRLTVVGRDNGRKLTYWNCRCDCGNLVSVRGDHLKEGRVHSCGCYKSEVSTAIHTTHGDSKSRLYHIYRTMLARCNNRKRYLYSRYGGRGITVCNEWQESYPAFRKWSMDNGYDESKSIDRIDNDAGYNPDNCRWTDSIIQANNKSNNRLVSANGVTKTLAEWERETGISQYLIKARIDRLGWSEQDAVTIPPKSTD